MRYWDDRKKKPRKGKKEEFTPSMQNKGIARMMMQHGMDALKERGYKSIHFLVNKHNVKAIKSYDVFGFNVVGECHMYDQDFFCYEKEL